MAAASGSKIRFDGRVVVVTGAGGGLGRAYALEYAKRGAAVVVNDLGGGVRGGDTAGRHSAADKVVEEIKASGGKAVANYDNVLNGEAVIKTAIDTYGRVDIVINNAGILRDVSFAKMTAQDWKLLVDVHLNGTYSVTKAAWPHMVASKYGRIIMVSSAAGLYGNFGQSHYSAVKMGILGFALALSQEGRSKNIHVNTIAPIAGSRMTETVMPADLIAALKPEYVAPLVLYLTHESTEETGSLFEVGGGYVAKLRWQRSFGHSFPLASAGIKPEQVAEQWSKVTDFTYNPQYPTGTRDAFEFIMNNLSNTGDESGSAASASAPASPTQQQQSSTRPVSKQRQSDGNSKVNVQQALAHQFEPMTFNYTERDVILYSLGIGAGADVAAAPDELQYVYENADNFQTFPTFGVIPPSAALGGILNVNGLSFNPMSLLHGEQYTELLKPLPTSGSLTSHARISNIYDKGSGAAVIMDVVTKDQQGQDILFNRYTVFIRGLGGFGGDKGPSAFDFNSPIATLAPTVVHRERTLENQAVLYRLSGDLNPLHVDASMAKMGNFDKPILHGLCTFGYAARAVVKHFANNDGKRFKSIRVRFVKPVYPGETLVISMWQVEPTKIVFKVRVAERGELVLIGQIELHPDQQSAASPAATAGAQSSSTLPTGTGFEAEKVFQQLAQLASPELVQKVKATYRFDLTKNGKTLCWLVDLKNGSGSVTGATESIKSDVSLALSDEDFVKLLAGKLDAQKAFMSGKIKFKGNLMLAQKLQLLKPAGSKL